MHTTNQILDAISEKHGGCSDYRICKLLNTSSAAAVANWRAGKTSPSLDFAHKAAALLEWDPAYVVACVEFERAAKDARLEQTDEIRATWEKIAQAFKPAAAVILAVVLGLSTPSPSKASASLSDGDHADDLYIMRSTRRFVRRMVRRVAQFLSIPVTTDCGATVSL